MPLTREQKQRLAGVLIAHTGTLVEFWTENTTTGYYQDVADLDFEEARQQLADWLGRLPGREWSVFLPQPSYTQSEETSTNAHENKA